MPCQFDWNVASFPAPGKPILSVLPRLQMLQNFYDCVLPACVFNYTLKVAWRADGFYFRARHNGTRAVTKRDSGVIHWKFLD